MADCWRLDARSKMDAAKWTQQMASSRVEPSEAKRNGAESSEAQPSRVESSRVERGRVESSRDHLPMRYSVSTCMHS